MNKWQIICPVVAMLIVGMLLASTHLREEEKELRAAIESHLGSLLDELQSHQEGGRFPSVQTAQKVLNDTAAGTRVHVTSLFGNGDLFYNPSEPLVGGDALVVCARVRHYGLVAIYGDRQVRVLDESELRQAKLVPLAAATSDAR